MMAAITTIVILVIIEIIEAIGVNNVIVDAVGLIVTTIVFLKAVDEIFDNPDPKDDVNRYFQEPPCQLHLKEDLTTILHQHQLMQTNQRE
jgi:hypothetical protein